MFLRRSVVQRCGISSFEMSSLRVGVQQVSFRGRAVVSGSQQDATVLLLLARRSTGNAMLWRRISGCVSFDTGVIYLWLRGITTYLHFSLFRVNRVFSFSISHRCYKLRQI